MKNLDEDIQQITLLAIYHKEIELEIERTFLDFDAEHRFIAAQDAIGSRLFVSDSELALNKEAHHVLREVKDCFSATPIPDIAGALKVVLSAIDRLKKEGDKNILMEFYFLLGVCYTCLPFEEDSDRQEENQYSAIQCFKQPLMYSIEQHRDDVTALLCIWLGDTYLRMPRDSFDEARFHLRGAISYYKQAKEKLHDPASGLEACRVHLGVAVAHSLMPQQRFAEHLNTVLESCRHVETNSNDDSAKLLCVLKEALIGMQYYQYMLVRDSAALGNSRTHLTRAIEACPASLSKGFRSRIASNLGDVCFHEEDWDAAIAAYAAMHEDCIERAPGTSNPFALPHDSEAARNLAFCHAKKGYVEAAFRMSENNKAIVIQRTFLDQLIVSQASQLAQSSYRDVLTRLRQAQHNFAYSRPASGALIAEVKHEGLPGPIRIYEHGTSEGSAGLKRAEEYFSAATNLEEKLKEYQTLLDKASRQVPLLKSLQSEATERARTMIDPHLTIVVPIITRQGTYVILVNRNSMDSVYLPQLTDLNLKGLLGQGRPDENGMTLFQRSERMDFGYFGAYHLRRNSPSIWFSVIDQILSLLGEMFWNPVLAHVPEATRRIIVIPDQGLSVLPMHAAYVSTSDKDIHPLVQDFSVSYMPSLSCLSLCRSIGKARAQPSLFCVVNPQKDNALQWTALEARAIRGLFSRNKILTGRKARRHAVLKGTGKFSYVHVASHGFFNWQSNINESGLRMSDSVITVNDLWAGLWDLQNARLVVLSACETGLVDIYSPASSELPGLPGAFLLAGVPAVLGTLWPVDDASSALLVSKFYSNHIEKAMDIPDALQAAQNWLRSAKTNDIETAVQEILRQMPRAKAALLRADISVRSRNAQEDDDQPFKHPNYWAPYVCFGL